jgi:hypothetical protein
MVENNAVGSLSVRRPIADGHVSLHCKVAPSINHWEGRG